MTEKRDALIFSVRLKSGGFESSVELRMPATEAECERHGFDKPFPPETEVRWRPSIYMPRWASRITLRVNAVKVERLQEISEDDVRAEGVEFEGERGFRVPPLELFSSLWNSINGPGAWDANPWVAAYSFERVKP